ncbi:MAG TPA: ferritin-like domain-containing protein [Terriglobia bacterium]|nr:ferritin-like domain-containing protein [Terriglobia bacterium]
MPNITNSSPPPDRSHIAPVKTREELFFLLERASELEHGLACIYLYAAYSLKNDASEGGLSEDQAKMVRGWKRRLAQVAVEEMLHLAQVSNMLTAIGASARFERSNFPMSASAFPFGLQLTLEPFSLETIERFVCYEMPEAGVLSAEQEAVYSPIRARVLAGEGRDPADDSGAGGAPLRIDAVEAGTGAEPFEVDFKTVGEFYHKIETGFETIPEDELFIGPPEAQTNARFVDLQGELVSVIDRKSACAAIQMIIEQGEAPTTAHPDAHFVIFDTIRKEFEQAVSAANANGAVFQPVRPVVSNPMTRFYEDTSGGTIILDPVTHQVADLFNVAYETMLLMLLRFFAHTEESEAELERLSRATLRIMTTVIRPLGEALAKMPVGDPKFPGMTAGPGFGYNRDVSLLPHKKSAWIFFGERLRELAIIAVRLCSQTGVPKEIEESAAALEGLAREFSPAGRSWSGAAELAEFQALETVKTPSIEPELNGPYLVTNVTTLNNSRGESIEARPQMALCRCGGSANKPFCDGTHARIGFESKKLGGRTPDHRDTYAGSQVTIYDNRGICQHAGFCTDNLAAVFKLRQDPWIDPNGAQAEAIIGQVRQCPSGALSYSVRGTEHRDRNRPPAITVSRDGPYRVTGGVELKVEPWGEGASKEHYALCRCGGSKNKPFCDGTHWSNGFKDERN